MFFTRFMSSVVLVVLSLFTIFAGGYFLGVVLLFLALTAYRELSKACKLEEDKTGLLGIIGYTGIIAYYGVCGKQDISFSGTDYDLSGIYVCVRVFFS